MKNRFEPGYTGDGFTHQADDAAEQEACDRAVEGVNNSNNVSCKHCDRFAQWKWTDADGNETAVICQRCMDTLECYRSYPIWQFTPLAGSRIARTSAIDILYMTDFSILDCGDTEGCRYVVEAVETDRDDTGRAATVHLGSFYSRKTAQLIVDALECFQTQVRGPVSASAS